VFNWLQFFIYLSRDLTQQKQTAGNSCFVSGHKMNSFKTVIFLSTISWILISCNQILAQNSSTKTKNINAGGLEFQASTVDPAMNEKFCSIGEIPEYPGGYDSLVSFVFKHIKYPKSAIRDSIEGRVVIQFIIDTNGRVINERIYKGVRTDIDTLCLSMIRQMPTWTRVGKVEGKPVAVLFNLPLNFTLKPEKKKRYSR
jgi:TonB family protein